jgi:hypothetical protein
MRTVCNLCRPELMVRDWAGAASRLCGRCCQRFWQDTQLLKQCEIVHQDATVFPSLLLREQTANQRGEDVDVSRIRDASCD